MNGVYKEEENSGFFSKKLMDKTVASLVKQKRDRLKKAPSLQVSARKFRATARADGIVKTVQARQGFSTYVSTINWIIEHHPVIENWHVLKKEKIFRDMEEAGLKPGDFILIDKKKKEWE